MTESIKKHVIASIRSLMKPIILLLLRNGVTYKEFAALCKSIFVEAAAEEFGIRGRPTNISRISVLTGIDRKEVKRLKDSLLSNETAEASARSRDRFTRILSAWHQNSDYIDAQGGPKILDVQGEKGSFTSLIRSYGGDIPVQAILKEMVRLNLVKLENSKAIVLQRDYFPAQSDPEALLRASSVIAELSETLYHNLYIADPDRPGLKKILRFERRASNNFMDVKHKKAFYKKLDEEGQAFLENIDSWMSERERSLSPPTLNNENEDNADFRFSVGVFGFDRETKQNGENDEP